MHKVSVLLLNYNRFDLTYDCIKSIINHSHNIELEIIVVDNNSTIGDSLLIEKDFPFVKWIKNKNNMGFAYANNQALSVSTGDYVCVLNNDTLFIEDLFTPLINYLEKLQTPALVGCKLLNSDLTLQDSIIDFDTVGNLFGEASFLYKIFPRSKIYNKYHWNYKNVSTPIEVDALKGAFLFGEKKYFDEIKGFDTRFFFYSEEIDLCKRFKQQGWKVIYYPENSIVHLGGATAESVSWFSFKNLSIGKIQYFQKHSTGSDFISLLFFHYLTMVSRIPYNLILGLLTFNKNKFVKAYYYLKTFSNYPKNLFK